MTDNEEDLNYQQIRHRLAALSGIPAMAITTAAHLRKVESMFAEAHIGNSISVEMALLIKIWNRLEWYAETPNDFEILGDLREHLETYKRLPHDQN